MVLFTNDFMKGVIVLQKMTEQQFEKLVFTRNRKECKHIVVKLTYLGMHSDYGCILCGMQSSVKKDFD